ncbi:MAG: thioredoxin family protein [Candidatus Kapaibacterium sp.]|jgi:peroxiredoxin|nr:thioredoxin family protein [Ignavibacteria bacterium]MBN8573990.1 thioredoxin family protein [Candidatus Kapabacteria bacterium]HRI30409.1 thioredoxin family protein [Candidatus Kapabacteria bacterium]
MKLFHTLFLGVFLLFSTQLIAADTYVLGSKVDDFTLKNIDGTMISLSSYTKNDGVVIVFTCNHCPYSKLYEDRIVALDASMKKKKYSVLAINPNDPIAYPDDSFENMIVRAKEKKFTFPYVIDETQEIAKKFGATRTPHFFILKKVNNSFEIAYIGALDDNAQEPDSVTVNYVEKAVDAIQKGDKVEPASTKAIGCSIKWKK